MTETREIPVKFRHIGANKKKVSIGLDVESELMTPNEFADLFRGKRITGRLLKPEDDDSLPGMGEPEHSVDGVFDSPGASLPADKLSATLSMPASEEILINLFRLTGGKGLLFVDKVELMTVEDKPKRGRPKGSKKKRSASGGENGAASESTASDSQERQTPVAPLPGQQDLISEDDGNLEPLEGDAEKLATPITSIKGIPERLLMSLVDCNLPTVERVLRWIRSGRELVGIGKAGRTKIADAVAAFMHGVPADDGLTGICYGCAKCSTRFKEKTVCPKCACDLVYQVGYHDDPSAIEDGSIVLHLESLSVDKGADGMAFNLLVGRDKNGKFRGGFVVLDGDSSIEEFYPNVTESASQTRSDALGVGAGKMLAKVESWEGDAQFLGQLRDKLKALGVKPA